MDDCIEAQWGLYIEYMRETLDYNIAIIPLTEPSAKRLLTRFQTLFRTKKRSRCKIRGCMAFSQPSMGLHLSRQHLESDPPPGGVFFLICRLSIVLWHSQNTKRF
jgi:hypothetical protein